MSTAAEFCRQALRSAVAQLPSFQPDTADLTQLRCALLLYQLSDRQHWLQRLRDACRVQDFPGLEPTARGAWLELLCDAWVVDANGPFRGNAAQLSALPCSGPQAINGLLRYWRITGEASFKEHALQLLKELDNTTGPAHAAAMLAGYRATGAQELLDEARRRLARPRPETLTIGWWPLARDLLDWGAEDVVDYVQSWPNGAPPPAAQICGLAPILLPILELKIRWWEASELDEGYVAEAVTFPYPAMRMRLERRDSPGQVYFEPSLGGNHYQQLEDAGIVASLLEQMVSEVDRQGILHGARRRTSRRPIGRQ
ncbi:MAG: hypothetical protein CMP23_14375 [Rickettsiales bacterium]|nr:hypothetical protein [Rickettsiales bacterium]|tara:strand:+ start:3491 stop:4429 length:939 start_codon:yes stop_codon:yes gene_type:complete